MDKETITTIIISALGLGSGWFGKDLFLWIVNRKKVEAEIGEKIAHTVSNILDANDKISKSLTDRIDQLESEVEELAEQNKVLIAKINLISDLMLSSSGDSVKKSDIARILK